MSVVVISRHITTLVGCSVQVGHRPGWSLVIFIVSRAAECRWITRPNVNIYEQETMQEERASGVVSIYNVSVFLKPALTQFLNALPFLQLEPIQLSSRRTHFLVLEPRDAELWLCVGISGSSFNWRKIWSAIFPFWRNFGKVEMLKVNSFVSSPEGFWCISDRGPVAELNLRSWWPVSYLNNDLQHVDCSLQLNILKQDSKIPWLR